MAIDTLLRTTAGTAATTSTSTQVARAAATVDDTRDSARDSAATGSGNAAPLRSTGSAAASTGGLQAAVARAQQALDYLERVATQLESLKSEISAKIASARNQAGSQTAAKSGNSAASRQQLESTIGQLTSTLAARQASAGGGVDADLHFDGQPARQRFRMRGIDIATLQQNAPQTVAFSVNGVGGPQLAASIDSGQSSEETARALDRALAPLGIRASLDNGSLVFTTLEANFPAVQDSIAVSGRGRVAADAVPPALAPQQWQPIGTGGSGGSDGGADADALRQSLREVVQALERVRNSQAAASSALSSASVQVSAASTPPPQVTIAADDFASAAASTNYDSLVALSSALVGVSRERVIALLSLG